MHILDVLKERGFIAQTTFEDELYKQLEEPTTFYVGFDPTADSLHIGHYIPIMAHGDDRRPVRQDRHAQDDDRRDD